MYHNLLIITLLIFALLNFFLSEVKFDLCLAQKYCEEISYFSYYVSHFCVFEF